jgi:hypothetical protein
VELLRPGLAAPSKEALEALHGVNQLEHLALRGAREITSLSVLGPCPNLRTLFLEGCVHLRGLSALRTARNLETLVVRDCPVRFDERLLSQLAGLRTFAVESNLPNLRELVLLNNSAVPDVGALAGMASLWRLRINGLARHLGPDADGYVTHLRAAGIQVEADGREDEWLFEETNEDGWADADDLAAIGGYEDFAPIQRRARMRTSRR